MSHNNYFRDKVASRMQRKAKLTRVLDVELHHTKRGAADYNSTPTKDRDVGVVDAVGELENTHQPQLVNVAGRAR